MKTKFAAIIAAFAIAAPAIALAGGGHDGDAKHERPSFPMTGKAFLDHVEQRLDHMEERIEARLDKSDKSDAEKEQIRAQYEATASKVMNAAQTAAADGTVTKEEAKTVRQAAPHKGKRGKGRKGGKGGPGAKGDRPNFPMTGSAFLSHVKERQAKMNAKVEERLAKSDLDAAKKAEIKARMAERNAALLAAANQAAADGTVTKEEAKAIRQNLRKDRKGDRKNRKGDRKNRKGKGKGKGKRGPSA